MPMLPAYLSRYDMHNNSVKCEDSMNRSSSQLLDPAEDEELSETTGGGNVVRIRSAEEELLFIGSAADLTSIMPKQGKYRFCVHGRVGPLRGLVTFLPGLNGEVV